MKILHLSVENKDNEITDTIALLTNEQIRYGYSVTLLTDIESTETRATLVQLPSKTKTLIGEIQNIRFLRRYLQEEKFSVVHAHTQKGSMLAFFASRFLPIPLVSSVYYAESATIVKRNFHLLGEKILPVNRSLSLHLNRNFNYPLTKMKVVPYAISAKDSTPLKKKANKTFIIGIAAEHHFLESPAARELMNHILPEFQKKNANAEFRVITSSYDVKNCNAIIGHGRIAVTALAHGIPVLGIGEASCIGLLQESNVQTALDINFGACGKKEDIDFQKIQKDLQKIIQPQSTERFQKISGFEEREFHSATISAKIQQAYIDAQCKKNGVHEIPVLQYKRIVQKKNTDEAQEPCVTKEECERQLRFLNKKRFTPLTFSDIQNIVEGKSVLSLKPIILTFDSPDGDFYQTVFPLLKKYTLKAVVFLSADKFIKHGSEQSSNPLALQQIQEMHEYGIEFGSSAMQGQRLTFFSDDKAKDAIHHSKEILEQTLNFPIRSFSYPFGTMTDKIKNEVQAAGYHFAVAEDSGSRNFWTDFLKIRRITINPHTSQFEFWKKTSGSYFWYTHVY